MQTLPQFRFIIHSSEEKNQAVKFTTAGLKTAPDKHRRYSSPYNYAYYPMICLRQGGGYISRWLTHKSKQTSCVFSHVSGRYEPRAMVNDDQFQSEINSRFCFPHWALGDHLGVPVGNKILHPDD
ncbi:hypothetical protein BaRGS_00036583 [Batillaria attramentaria]|uniref:Uncharacterized protein n=1 Tax=Batillaria attramentaria TaxID=370345 RepID=A0ABD0JB31_9CAEN